MFSVEFPLKLVEFPSKSVKFPLKLAECPPNSVKFPLILCIKLVMEIVEFFIHDASVLLVVQLVVAGSIGPVMRLATGWRALVAPKMRTVQMKVFLNPMYFGMIGNTMTYMRRGSEGDRREEKCEGSGVKV